MELVLAPVFMTFDVESRNRATYLLCDVLEIREVSGEALSKVNTVLTHAVVREHTICGAVVRGVAVVSSMRKGVFPS